MRPSTKTLREFIRDERRGVKEYRRYGLLSLAHDESKHMKFLLRELRRRKRI